MKTNALPFFLFLSLVCICVLFAFRIIDPSKKSGEAEDMNQLRKLNARFINNFITNDTVSHSQIIHKRFVCITTQGLWVNRKDYLNDWASGYNADATPYFDYRNEQINIFGSTALVRAVTKKISVTDGKESMVMTQYTDVYIKESGQWKCIQAQLTNVAPENYPADKTIVKQYRNGLLQ